MLMLFFIQVLPGIFRLRSHWLPTLATDAALLLRVMLSFIRPSPVTFTVKALPVGETMGEIKTACLNHTAINDQLNMAF